MSIDQTVYVGTRCPICDRESVVKVSSLEMDAWMRGTSIQVAMPSLSSDDRERLMTGICPTCWSSMFRAEQSDAG